MGKCDDKCLGQEKTDKKSTYQFFNMFFLSNYENK